jgi:hypothetical protein
MAPITMPMKNGVSSEEKAKPASPLVAAAAVVCTW